MCVCVCVVYVYVCMCTYMCAFIYIYTYFMCTYIYVLYIPIFCAIWLKKCDFLTEKLGIKPDPDPKLFIPDPDPSESSGSGTTTPLFCTRSRQSLSPSCHGDHAGAQNSRCGRTYWMYRAGGEKQAYPCSGTLSSAGPVLSVLFLPHF